MPSPQMTFLSKASVVGYMGTRCLMSTKSLWGDEEVGIGILILLIGEAIVQKDKLISLGI